jgi:hypothetical protein
VVNDLCPSPWSAILLSVTILANEEVVLDDSTWPFHSNNSYSTHQRTKVRVLENTKFIPIVYLKVRKMTCIYIYEAVYPL